VSPGIVRITSLGPSADDKAPQRCQLVSGKIIHSLVTQDLYHTDDVSRRFPSP
jgi:hypothetical protein